MRCSTNKIGYNIYADKLGPNEAQRHDTSIIYIYKFSIFFINVKGDNRLLAIFLVGVLYVRAGIHWA